MRKMSRYLLVNFGGPRDLEEIPAFLAALLTDRDVIRTKLPHFLHNWLFRRIARKRSLKIRKDYEEIGGKSPIYFDTEKLKELLSERLSSPVVTFHRYLPATHSEALRQISAHDKWVVLPLFPQFSYATTGSIARFFSAQPQKFLWIRSYAAHPAFIAAYKKRLAAFLQEQNLSQSDVFLLFSAHGLPRQFVDEGDPYEQECLGSYEAVMRAFPQVPSILCYQSKFGRGEWLRPYTNEVCEGILKHHTGKKHVVVVPISFTSDHIETQFEIEELYLPLIRAKELEAYRCPALNLEPYWVDALVEILKEPDLTPNHSLIFANGSCSGHAPNILRAPFR